MIRASINTTCGRCITELVLTGKEIFSEDDIKKALAKVGRGSTTACKAYMGTKGHLATRGFLERPPGGWVLADATKHSSTIMVKITPGNEYLLGEVSTAIDEALRGFKGVVETRMEV